MFTDISTGPILWTIINFSILLVVLTKLGWKPITQALAKREKSINDAAELAQKTREEASSMAADKRAILAKAEVEAQSLLRESREYAQKVRDEAVGKADDEGKKLIARAKSEIERSRIEAMIRLRAEVASLAVGASERILKGTIDHQKGAELVEAYLSETAVSSN